MGAEIQNEVCRLSPSDATVVGKILRQRHLPGSEERRLVVRITSTRCQIGVRELVAEGGDRIGRTSLGVVG